MPLFAESLTVVVNGRVAPKTILVLPEGRAMTVPTTETVRLATMGVVVPAGMTLAFTVSVRLVLLAPILSVAVAGPVVVELELPPVPTPDILLINAGLVTGSITWKVMGWLDN